MLGKLINYEFKATARYYIPLLVITMCLAIVNKIFLVSGWFSKGGVFSIISGIFIFSFILLLMGVFIGGMCLLIFRFFKNFLTEEGYLMFTLPVKVSSLIWSKLIIAVFWLFISVIVAIGSILFLVWEKEVIYELGRIWDELTSMFHAFHINERLFIAEAILLGIVSLIQELLFFYACIAIGQVISKHKIIGAFASYFILNIVQQIIFSIAAFAPFLRTINNESLVVSTMTNIMMPITILLTFVFSIAYFVITNYILSRKLNLE